MPSTAIGLRTAAVLAWGVALFSFSATWVGGKESFVALAVSGICLLAGLVMMGLTDRLDGGDS